MTIVTTTSIKNLIIALIAVAERAAWVGNDETHYARKWEEHDIEDLKKLIKAVVAWIDLVEISSDYKKAMPKPEGGKK